MVTGDSVGGGFRIGTFTASSAAQARPDSQILAAPDDEIELSWSIAGKPDKLFLAVEEPTGPFSWRIVLEEPIDAGSTAAKRKAPELAADAKEKRYRYRLTAHEGEQRAHASVEVYVHAAQSGRVHSQVAHLRRSRIGAEGYVPLKSGNPSTPGIIEELLEAKDSAQKSGKPFKLAITATGGGARGAWEAGAGEALFRALHEAKIRPSIIAGTSAGGLVATGLFADWVYEKGATPDKQGVLSKQGTLWRDIASGNGSNKVAGNSAFLLRWASDEQENPFTKLSKDWGRIGDAMVACPKAEASLVRAVANFPFPSKGIADYIAHSVLDFVNRGMQPDPQAQRDLQSIKDAATAFDKAAPWDKPGAAINVAVKALTAQWDGLLRVFNIGGGVLGEIEQQARKFGDGVEEFIRDVRDALQALARGAGALADFGPQLDTCLAHLGYLVTVAATQDHLLENVHIQGLLQDFLQKCFLSMHKPPALYAWSRMVTDWAQNQFEPELFLTGANLSASRLTVFAAAQPPSIKALIDQGIWTVDITDRFPPSVFTDPHWKPTPENRKPTPENFFNVTRGTGEDALIKSALTTAALPFAFPVQHWDLTRVVMSNGNALPAEHVSHDFTDGGVLDSSPIDIALYAGATHVISLEMTPLLFNAWTYKGWAHKERTLLDVGMNSFYTAMDGALLRTIEDLVQEQHGVQIYRLAPFAPRTVETQDPDDPRKRIHKTVSPDIMNFDGVFDPKSHERQMSLDDWFMQGYLDGGNLEGDAAANDPVFKPYRDAAKTPQPARPMGNLYWRVTTQPLPDAFPKDAHDLPVKDLLGTAVT